MGINLSRLQQENQERIQRKLNANQAETFVSGEEENKLTLLPALTLQRKLFSGSNEITLPKILKIYKAKHRQFANKGNPLADFFTESSEKHANDLQAILTGSPKEGSEKLPLLGFIMSIKETIIYKDSDCTFGFQSFMGHPYKKTAKIIEHLESKGAVVICKGNAGQSLLMTETISTPFGSTENPLNSSRTAGGSSGGEASLVASRLVNCAIGSDLLGDLRLPALYCGVYAFKPTATRFANAEATMVQHPFLGVKLVDHQPLLASTIGPIAGNIDDLEALAICLNDFNQIDRNLPPLAWNRPQQPKRIGVIKEFAGVLELCQSSRRVLEDTIQILKSQGVEVVEIDLNDLVEEIFVRTYAIIFKDEVFNGLLKESLGIKEPLNDNLILFKAKKFWSTSQLKQFVAENKGKDRDALFCESEVLGRENNFISMLKRQVQIVDEVIRRFASAKVECAICPGVFPAALQNTAEWTAILTVYTAIWNYLNFPVGAIPMGKVNENEQFYETSKDDSTAKILKKCLENSKDLPVGVQVVGIPWRDELVIETMKLIDKNMEKK